jgi:hypothetical protein
MLGIFMMRLVLMMRRIGIGLLMLMVRVGVILVMEMRGLKTVGIVTGLMGDIVQMRLVIILMLIMGVIIVRRCRVCLMGISMRMGKVGVLMMV